MRMEKFRIQNYKKVGDSGWITTGDLVCLVGKNESGKSSIFRGLSKLNPSDGEKYDGLKEFPRRRYTSEFKQRDWPVSSVEFSLTEAEGKELQKTVSTVECKSVVCIRHYSGALDVRFNPEPKIPEASTRAYLGKIEDWQRQLEQSVAPEGKGDALASIKTKLLPYLTQKIAELKNVPADSQVNEGLTNEVATTVMAQLNESWQKEQLKGIVDGIGQFREALAFKGQLQAAKVWVEQHLPRFVYFDRYDVIDSAIHVPNFIQQLSQNPSAPRVRSTKCLFQHVGLDLAGLQKLDPTQPNKTADELKRFADERAILMSSASNAMTKRFSEWWEQRMHIFRYQIDGPFFRVWVSDDLDPSEIELDQRSAGMQYFFSFYTVFLEEAKGAYSNSILLLDEAGLQLHGTAQQKIVKFLDKLSKDNQLLYTTHSPFMVDGDHLERVRVVYEDQSDGTAKVSEDVWPKDRDSLFPLQAALGYSIAQTLFYARRQLVVEGITDYWILKDMDGLLAKKGLKSLSEEAVIVPSGGVNSLMPLAALLLANRLDIRVLLDGDEPGLRKGKEIETKLMVECFFLSNYAKKEGAELEDMFPEKLYLDAVGAAYPSVALKFTKEETEIGPMTKRIETAFARIGGTKFEKWRPARVITDWIQDKPDMISPETLNRFEAVFDAVNQSWGTRAIPPRGT